MFNSFWNVSPKSYSRAQRKACQKKKIYKGDPFPEIELPRRCDEQSDRQTLDFRGAIKILDDEDDLLVINENFGSGHLAIPLRTKQGSNKASDIASANVPFSSFDDFNPDDDRWTAFNSTPRSSSMIGADEEIDDLSTIRSEEFNLTSVTDDASDREQGASEMFSNASDKENEAADRRRASDKETEDVTPVETKNKFLRAKCRKGTPHPMVKLPPLVRLGKLFEPVKNKRNATTKEEAARKQKGGLASFPKHGDIAMKATNRKISEENDEKWEMKFKNNDENRLNDKKSKYPDKVDVQFASSKVPVSRASGANPRNAVGLQALLKPKPKLKSSLAIKVVPCVDDDPKNMDEFPVVEMFATNQPGCCHDDDSSPDIENNTLKGNRKTDDVTPTCGRIAKSIRIEDSARSSDDDFTLFRPPRSKRTKIQRKKGNLGSRKKKSNKTEGRRRKPPRQNPVSKKELDFVKISELLGVLKTNNEDDDDIRTRADFDEEGSPSKQNLEIPARRIPLPSVKKQLTSTIICHDGDRGFASETLKSSLRPHSMSLSSIRCEAESSLLEKHPTTREVDSRELMESASPGNRSVGHSRVADEENVCRVENIKITEEGEAAAESELPVSKDLEKMNNDSIEECWLTQDIDYDWGPCYLEVYKYQTFDPNFDYPQDDLELA